MANKSRILLFLLLFTSFCRLSAAMPPSGKIRVTTEVDGVTREYFIHVPASYDGSQKVPLVFMLHGTSGDGETFYNAYGWTELADEEGFIAVFPSSGRYKISDDGENKTTTKWNTQPDADWTFQPGEMGYDDIKFLRKVVAEMLENYNIDPKRVYLNGFSNGGQMASKCAVEMSDLLAAVAANAGSFFIDTTYFPKRKLPTLFQVGNKDYGPGNEGPEGSLALLDTLLKTPDVPWMNGKHYRISQAFIRNFNLQSDFVIEGDTNTAVVATFQPNNPGPGTGYEFKFVFVKGLAHAYPNGNNHFFDAPRIHWDWMKQYVLEDTVKSSGQKIRVTTDVDNIEREYFVHLPASYDGSQKVPLVFMLHGTSGDGEKFYDSYGWTELADKEGFIAVFPSSGRLKITEDGVNTTTTKWNILPDANWTLQPGEKAQDDIKFLRKVISEMQSNYNIDSKRVYLNGFSNGGAMAAKCAIEMSDVLAAVAQNASSFQIDTTYIPKRKLPVLFQVGNKDYGPGNEGPEVSLALFDSLISTPGITYLNGKHYRIAQSHIRNFDLQETFTLEGDTSTAMIATYLPNNPGPGTGYEFKYIFVKRLPHIYPNGVIHFFDAPRVHWDWMKKYQLETADSSAEFTLKTVNGHGGGNFKKGDTLHIWSSQQDGKVFTHWTGDIQYLESPREYHTRVFMPNQHVTVTANYATLQPDMKLNQVKIMGAQKEKTVYLYLPDKNQMKGMIWFLHGTNGNASSMAFNVETKQFIDLMMTLNYGIIAISSEESQDNTDYDGNGAIQWSYSLDSNAIDYANIRAIRDSLFAGNRLSPSTPHYAYGYSAGGAFAEFVVNVLNWRAAIGHTVSGSTLLSQNADKPFYLSVNVNDNHPGVGPAGNAEAELNIKNYTDRGVCAVFHKFEASPLYPERLDRSSFIGEELSKAVFQELKKNNDLDENNYLRLSSEALKAKILSTPAKYPVIVSMNAAQLNDLEDQIAVVHAEHKVKADINGSLIEWLDSLCGTVETNEVETHSENIHIFPNPAQNGVWMNHKTSWVLYNVQGGIVKTGFGDFIDLSSTSSGLYILQTKMGSEKIVKL